VHDAVRGEDRDKHNSTKKSPRFGQFDFTTCLSLLVVDKAQRKQRQHSEHRDEEQHDAKIAPDVVMLEQRARNRNRVAVE